MLDAVRWDRLSSETIHELRDERVFGRHDLVVDGAKAAVVKDFTAIYEIKQHIAVGQRHVSGPVCIQAVMCGPACFAVVNKVLIARPQTHTAVN